MHVSPRGKQRGGPFQGKAPGWLPGKGRRVGGRGGRGQWLTKGTWILGQLQWPQAGGLAAAKSLLIQNVPTGRQPAAFAGCWARGAGRWVLVLEVKWDSSLILAWPGRPCSAFSRPTPPLVGGAPNSHLTTLGLAGWGAGGRISQQRTACSVETCQPPAATGEDHKQGFPA